MISRLQAARTERGWSQARLVHELRRCAAPSGIGLPGDSSLKAQISRWENGRVEPDATYRRLLREIYGLDDAELGFGRSADAVETDQGYSELRACLDAARTIGREGLHLLQAQTDTLRRLDRLQGSPMLLEQMRPHLQNLERSLRLSMPGAQRRSPAGAGRFIGRVLWDAAC